MSKATEAVKKALRVYNDEHGGWLNGLLDYEWTAISELATEAVIEALFPGDPVRAWYPWKTNADLIYDVWRAGYVKGEVFDATPGDDGLWWRRLARLRDGEVDQRRKWEWLVDGLTGLYLNEMPDGGHYDFRDTPYRDDSFDTVAFDPPYKLNGNPNGLPELSRRYGVDVPAKWQDRHLLMYQGLVECIRITKPGGFILAKCQDQVVSGEMRWQTDLMKDWAEHADYAERVTALQIDRFDMLGHHIPQPMGKSERYPKGRKQKHAHARPSTLLVFKKERMR